jgi:Ca-activated chloride channel family protein
MGKLIFSCTILAVAFTSVAQDVPQTFRVNVDLVQVHATVSDLDGRYVIGLGKEHFQVLEDGVEQEIQTFASDDVPFSLGIIVDVGKGVEQQLQVAKEAAALFLKAGNVANEYFVIEFNEKPFVTIDYTRDVMRLQNIEEFLPSTRDKAILDAIHLGLEKLEEARNPGKLLLVITAGGDTNSERTAADVRELARQQNVQIYGVSPPIDIDVWGRVDRPPVIAADIIESIGGRGFGSVAGFDLQDVCRRIAVAVRNQYVVGYRSTNPARDGKFRKVDVKLNLTKGLPELFVHTRSGYYAPES